MQAIFKLDPYTVKSSMKIFITSSAKSENMDIIHLWNVAGALHKPNGILLNAKVPNGHVNVVFSCLQVQWQFGCIQNIHQENISEGVLLTYPTSDQ